MIDMHSHFLPKIDDGSQSRDTSVEMLKASYEQGIRTMVATPHFYINRTRAEHFTEKRNASYKALLEYIKEKNITVPDIILGAEVCFFRGISKYDGLDMLKIGNTDYMLLEMPFERWTDHTIEEVRQLKEDADIIPVIAHIERYIDFQKGTDNIEKLLEVDTPIQMNAEYVNSFFTRGKAIKMITDGTVDVLGSDCHNMDKRCPNLGNCMRFIEKKCGAAAVDNIIANSKKLLGLN